MHNINNNIIIIFIYFMVESAENASAVVQGYLHNHWEYTTHMLDRDWVWYYLQTKWAKMVLPFLRFDIKCIYRNVTVSRSAPRKRLLDWSLRQISSSACLSQSQFFIKRSTISSSGMHICPSGFHQAVLGLGTFIKRWITLSFEKSSPLPLNNFRGLSPS